MFTPVRSTQGSTKWNVEATILHASSTTYLLPGADADGAVHVSFQSNKNRPKHCGWNVHSCSVENKLGRPASVLHESGMAAAELLVKFSFRIRDKDYTQIFFMSVDAEERLELGQMKTKR